MLQELGLGEDAARVVQEVPEQLVFRPGEVESRVAPPDFAEILVHHEIGVGQVAMVGRRACPAQHGADPGHEFGETKGLGQVVVTADRQAGHPVLRSITRRQEHHRDPPPGGPEAAGDLETGHVGEHHVENDEVGLALLDGGQDLAAVACLRHGEPLIAQGGRDEIQEVRLVVRDEDPCALVRRSGSSHQGVVAHGAIIVGPSVNRR